MRTPSADNCESLVVRRKSGLKTTHYSRLTAYSLLILLLTLPLSGCFFSREIGQTRRDIERAYPDLQLRKQIVLNLGPISLRTLGWFTKLAPEEEGDMAARYLRDISRVKVGVFRSDNPAELERLNISRLGFEKEWTVALKTRDDDSRVWVLYRENAKTLKDLYVVVLDEEQLVVARVHGRLQRLVTRIMEDHGDLDFLTSGHDGDHEVVAIEK